MTIQPDFSKAIPTTEAERYKFVKANTENDLFEDLPEFSKRYSVLTLDVNNLGGSNVVDFSQTYATEEAERSKFVKLDNSTITGLSSTSRGRYALLTYPVNGVTNTKQATGNIISFDNAYIYNTREEPTSGSITVNYDNAKLGIIQKIYHEDSAEPNLPASWIKVSDSTGYALNQLNIIYVEYIGDNKAEYWFTVADDSSLPSSYTYTLNPSSTELLINKEAFNRMYNFTVYITDGSTKARTENITTTVLDISTASLYDSTPSIGDTSDVTLNSFISGENIMVTAENVGADTYNIIFKDWK